MGVRGWMRGLSKFKELWNQPEGRIGQHRLQRCKVRITAEDHTGFGPLDVGNPDRVQRQTGQLRSFSFLYKHKGGNLNTYLSDGPKLPQEANERGDLRKYGLTKKPYHMEEEEDLAHFGEQAMKSKVR